LSGTIGTVIGGRLFARFANRVNGAVLKRVVGTAFRLFGVMMLIDLGK